MGNVFSKVLRGVFFGIGAAAVLCVVVLLFDVFDFLGEFESFELSKFQLKIWRVSTYIIVLAIGAVCGAIVGFIIGLVMNADRSRRNSDLKMEERSEGAIRQRRRFAAEIKTMSDNVQDSCRERAMADHSILHVSYCSEKMIEDIMSGLVSFTEYERVLKNAAEDISDREVST